MRRTSLFVTAGLFLSVFAVSVIPVMGDETAIAGRQIVVKCQKAIVTVQIAAKTTMSADGRSPFTDENKGEFSGVIIDPSGLLVMPLSQTSPEGRYGQMISDSEDSFKVTSEITDMKVLMPDGKKVPYKVVLRDKDLDLAFLRPATKLTEPVAAIDFKDASKPEVLDLIIQLDRLGTLAGRAYAAYTGRIQAVVEKPRTFFVSGGLAMGSPVFTLDGKIVGLVVVRAMPSAGRTAGSPSAMPIILPASDILDAAKQAPEATP